MNPVVIKTGSNNEEKSFYYPPTYRSSSTSNSYRTDYEIRPPFIQQLLDGSRTTSKTIPSVNHHQINGSHGPSSSLSTVTGVPQLVELDDAVFNPLDPGQLLRESAAAASRAALQDPLPTPLPPPPMLDNHNARLFRRASSTSSNSSILVDDLLHQIYNHQDDDSDDSSSVTCSPTKRADPLRRKGTWELEVMRDHLREALSRVTTSLIQQLTRRDRLLLERDRHFDVITAILQAASQKRSQDTKMRFSLDPINSSGGDSGFQQWHDAMRMVARLPGGVPPEFRRKLWLTLAEQHLIRIGVDWAEAERNCFNDRINPDDEDLGAQIVRDLHRTGCSLFCGEDAIPNQALLKRVLLAYARWNKGVGYCQGLNVLAALLLEVMGRSEIESLKVMIYLIEGVLPEGYFANNLRGLSVDMAVFRDLLRQRVPVLSRHLEALQQSDPASIEPPLTNVFTMQWFLTLFATCLPKPAVLRVWDLIFLEGNDVLLRTALAIWRTLAERILTVRTCDDFYSIMAVLAREMLEFGLMEPNHLVQTIVSMGPFPLPGLSELRDKYRYNITPWNSSSSGRVRLFYNDDDTDGPEEDNDQDEEKNNKAFHAVATVFGGLTPSALVRQGRRITDRTFSRKQSTSSSGGSSEKEKLQLDIAALRKQYARLKERQKQAHVMFWTAAVQNATGSSGTSFSGGRRGSLQSQTGNAATTGMNPVSHLLAGRKPLLTRRTSSPTHSGDSAASAAPKLKLPPARIIPPVENKVSSSAPTTPSEGPVPQKQQHQKTNIPQTKISSAQLPSGMPPMASGTANRSRLVQELLEQNSAILQKLKDRPPSQDRGDSEILNTKSGIQHHHHHPFPTSRQSIRPKEVALQLGLYSTTGSSASSTSQKY